MLIFASVYHPCECYKIYSVTSQLQWLECGHSVYINKENCDLVKPSEKTFTEFEFYWNVWDWHLS